MGCTPKTQKSATAAAVCGLCRYISIICLCLWVFYPTPPLDQRMKFSADALVIADSLMLTVGGGFHQSEKAGGAAEAGGGKTQGT